MARRRAPVRHADRDEAPGRLPPLIEEDPVEIALLVAGALDACQVEYFLTGSVASGIHHVTSSRERIHRLAPRSKPRRGCASTAVLQTRSA